MLKPEQSEFEALAARGFNLIPVCREIAADLETPVSAFLKVAGERDYSFLLESLSGGEKWARYSFLGAEPSLVMKLRGERVERIVPHGTPEIRRASNPLDEIRRELGRFRAPELPYLPRFFGGAVGFLSYDLVRSIEGLAPAAHRALETPEMCLVFTDSLLVFDNLSQKIKVIANVALDDFDSTHAAYASAQQRIENLIERLGGPPTAPKIAGPPSGESEDGDGDEVALSPATSREDYVAALSRAREHILAGEALRIVPTRRFQTPLNAHPFNLYRGLRATSPSPYMFYLRLGEETLVGASPESMVRVEGREVTLRPTAGTRPRGASEAEDRGLESQMLADAGDRAAHLTLVDAARGDLGRVTRTGSVEVTELMTVERYADEMLMVSNVRGILSEGADACAALGAVFPPGGAAGLPRRRAVELLEELEPMRRGVFFGAVGYFSFIGNLDAAIASRTMLVRDGHIYLQTGDAVEAHSEVAALYESSMARARTIGRAIAAARELERGGAGK
jgi:anthranilate synthase component I